ncbi:MAG: hypothetical protein MUP85_15615, partial [Candidatus Lokiarchaeota archaeon]|nr:hypothetical protein [Candidatus Lokiarchaeota archaeon]
ELFQLSTKEILFILSVQLTSRLIKSNETSQVLASFIKQKIENLCKNFLTDKDWKNDIVVIGMGSLGAGEITFASDIDLVFAVHEIHKSEDIQKYFQEFLSILKKELSPFDVDCRLRPEGKSSHLVWDLKSYSDYLKNRARIWEFQAFLKADLIFGNKKYFNALIKDYIKSIQGFEQNIIKKEMLEMRRKSISSDSISGSTNIKRCSGGLTDIEYIISYFLLSDSQVITNTIGIRIEDCAKLLSLEKDYKVDFELLAQNFNKLKEIELANQNLFDSRTPRIPVDEIKLKSLSVFLNYSSSKLFLYDLNKILQFNIKIFKQVFG